jgi:AraC-like DNA-binding protein
MVGSRETKTPAPVPEGPTIGLRSLVAMVQFVSSLGFDPQPVLRVARVTDDMLSDPERRLSREDWTAGWLEGERITGDPLLGLHFAEWVPFGAFDVLDYYVVRSRDVRSAFEGLASYFPLIHDGVRVEIVDAPDGTTCVSYVVQGGSPETSRLSSELTFSVLVRRFQTVARAPLELVRVGFRRRRPPNAQAYEAFFGVPVVFGAPADQLVLRTESLSRPLPSADPRLCVVLERHARDLMARILRHESLSDRVRQILMQEVPGGNPSLEWVASRLALSPRTLQRRLRDEGTTHVALLDDLRRDLAIGYLKEKRVPIGEIAFLLGFSEPSAFHRAFRRWTGSTPGEVRNQTAPG